MVKNWHQPQKLCIRHDSLVNPTQNPEEPLLLTDYFRATSQGVFSDHSLATSIVQPTRRLVPHLFRCMTDPFSFLDVPGHIHDHDTIHAFH
jgi:hypothetical protein